jgi:tRNA threonylcarbamoyladenosine biosynthesis protein TsaB
MTTGRDGFDQNLAVETSGRLGSVVLGRGDEILAARQLSGGMRHAVELLPTIDKLCRQKGLTSADLSDLYVSGGPGSFTGLRIGISLARTLAWSCGIRVVRVPTLDVVAQNALEVAQPPPLLGVLLDAKRKKVYAASYVLEAQDYRRVDEPAERDPDAFFSSLSRPAALIGEGIPYARAAVARSGLPVLPEETYVAKAEAVYRLGRRLAAAGRYDDPGELTPIYVRRPEAEEVWERRYGQSASNAEHV